MPAAYACVQNRPFIIIGLSGKTDGLDRYGDKRDGGHYFPTTVTEGFSRKDSLGEVI